MSGKNQQGSMDVKQKNVLQAPLHQHAPTGFCTPSNPIALTLTKSFLSFASLNNISLPNNAQAGDRTCISAANWKTTTEKSGDGQKDVARVKLEGTHVAALDVVDLDMLKKWAAGQDVDRGVEWTKDQRSGFVRESGEIGGKEPRA